MKLVTLLMFGFVSAASARTDGLISLEFAHSNGTYRIEVRQADLLSSPNWIPGKEEAPVSVNRACALAQEAMNKAFPEFKHLTVAEIRLIPSEFGADARERRMYYQIRYEESFRRDNYQNGKLASATFSFVHVIVLMDGRVFVPQRVDAKRD